MVGMVGLTGAFGKAVAAASLIIVFGVASGCNRNQPGAPAPQPAPAASSVAPAAVPAAPQPETAAAVEEPVTLNGMTSLPPIELRKKADRYAPVVIGYDESQLSETHRKIVNLLVDAADVMGELFWAQASADGWKVFQALQAMDGPSVSTLRRYVRINCGRFDRLDEFAPFLGGTPSPLGAAFYPSDMTKDELDAYIAANPAARAALLSEFTVVQRNDDGGFTAVPYSEFYGPALAVAAAKLREAAALTDNESFRHFLETRAAAFLSNDYFESDMAWMDVEGSLIELTMGPYEVYEDRLFNAKAAFEAFVTLVDPAAARELEAVAAHLPQMERHLPIPDEHKNLGRGGESPIRVVDVIYTAGDTRAGVQTLAFNLPNDERVREAKGSKKVLLRNISNAKFTKILQPIAERVVVAEQLQFLSEDAYFKHTLMHEMSHGIGPGNLTLADGTATNVQQMLRELYSPIEEAKADTLGIYNAFFLIDEGVFPKEMFEQTAVTTMAGAFRSVRFGGGGAHGRANLLIFNYLTQEGAYVVDSETGRFRVLLDKIRPAVTKLATELLMVEALGDYAGAAKLLETHGQVGPAMQAALDWLTDIPVDIEPVFTIEQQRQAKPATTVGE